MKLTKWFDGRKFVPAHVGVYECGDGFYRNWNGEFWGFYARSTESASRTNVSNNESACQNLDWRGLAENPNDNKKV